MSSSPSRYSPKRGIRRPGSVLASKMNFRQDEQTFEKTDVPDRALEAKREVLASKQQDALGLARPAWNSSTGPNLSGVPLRAIGEHFMGDCCCRVCFRLSILTYYSSNLFHLYIITARKCATNRFAHLTDFKFEVDHMRTLSRADQSRAIDAGCAYSIVNLLCSYCCFCCASCRECCKL